MMDDLIGRQSIHDQQSSSIRSSNAWLVKTKSAEDMGYSLEQAQPSRPKKGKFDKFNDFLERVLDRSRL